MNVTTSSMLCADDSSIWLWFSGHCGGTLCVESITIQHPTSNIQLKQHVHIIHMSDKWKLSVEAMRARG